MSSARIVLVAGATVLIGAVAWLGMTAGRPADDASAALDAAVGSTGGAGPSTAAALPQFLRDTPRARITGAVVDHDPIARGSTVRLALEVEMLPGMHVNANPATHDWMIPVAASLGEIEGIRVLDAFYPEAETRKFPYDDEPYRVYEDSLVIGLLLAVDEALPPGGRELEIVLDYQACNDEACFAPAKADFRLALMVVADRADAGVVSSPLLDRAPFPQ